MTREHKLALIFGFALVLVVGLLISDNFSASRKSEPGGPQMAEAQPPMFKEEVLVADGATAKPEISAVPTSPVSVPITDPAAGGSAVASGDTGSGVVPVTMGTNTGENTIAGRFGQAWNETMTELGNGHASTPEAAQMDGRTTGAVPLTTPASGPQVGFQTPGSGESMFQPTPTRAPFEGNGLGGPGEDTTKLGAKPSELPGSATATAPAPAPGTESKPEPASKDGVHRIVEGDSFWKIARKHYNDGSLAEALKTYNKGRIGKNGQLRTGASLLIPEKSVLKSGASAKPETKTAEVKPEKKSELKVPSIGTIEKAAGKKVEAKNETAKKSGATTYVVKEGDTLGKIAKKLLGSSKRWPEILDANSSLLDSEDDVQAGQTLKIPAR